MFDKEIFLEVLSRLKLVLDVDGDAAVAVRLGLSKTAFNNRKLRGSLPTSAIEALIESEGLSREFIYEGTGSVHVDTDAGSWEAGLNKRLAQSLGLATYVDVLVREGYAKAALKAVAGGKQAPLPKLLRDMRRCLALDLNWLVCGDTDTALSQEERALVAAYRKAPSVGKEFIRQAAGMAAGSKGNT